MKKIAIQVPEGKSAEWKNGVLTLVDEPNVNNRPITERVKTFEDACKELGDEHQLVEEYKDVCGIYKGKYTATFGDIVAYLKLRIITAALNEGWEPQFTEDEYRYFPWFYLYTKEEYDEMDEEKKRCCVLRSSNSPIVSFGFVYVNAFNVVSSSGTNTASQLACKSNALARYAGKQFTKEWADFMFKSN